MENNERESVKTFTMSKAMMPLRVQFRAQELGIHERCLEVDHEGACETCKIVMFEVFEQYYGHAESSEDAMIMILSDIIRDREAFY